MKYLCLALCFLGLVSCRKEEVEYKPVELCNERTNNVDSVKMLFNGTWEWQEEKFDRWRDPTKYNTPESEKSSRWLRIVGDSAYFYRALQFEAAYRVSIVKKSEARPGPDYLLDSSAVLAFYNEMGRIYSDVRIYMCNNQMILYYAWGSEEFGRQIWKKLR